MSQMYIIYVKDSIIRIQEGAEKNSDEAQEIDNKYVTKDLIAQIHLMLESNEAVSLNIIVPDAKKYLKNLSQEMHYIQAAGGLITNDSGAWLFIFRRGKWDLPKGKIEDQEQPAQAAIREVEEECGLKIDHAETEVDSTYHIYMQDLQLVLKRTHWYLMHSRGVQELTPQAEEEITAVRWFTTGELSEIHDNTYLSVGQVMKNIARA